MREWITHCARGACVESTLFDGTLDATSMAMATNTQRQDLFEPKLAPAQVEAVLKRLSKEDSKLGERLISAAAAGAVVARQPADMILRAEAAEAWNSIRPVIAHHLSSEENVIVPWLKSLKDFPADLILRTREQHRRLCDLGRIVDAVSFITGSDEEVTKAGTALTAFAVCLDDLIDGEERDLFPMIQRCLFGESSGPAS